MPPRGHHDGGTRVRKAAELYLQSERDHDGLTVADAAERFGVYKGAVSRMVKRLRAEQEAKAA